MQARGGGTTVGGASTGIGEGIGACGSAPPPKRGLLCTQRRMASLDRISFWTPPTAMSVVFR
jgi:hypothetical protein